MITSDIELLEVFYAHTISPIAIAILFSLISSLYISSFHPLLGGIAVAAYLTVGLLIPLLISKMSGADGMNFRTKSGELSSFVLDSLRGLDQTIQYGAGESRQEQMKEKSDALSLDEARLKRIAGRNLAMTNTIILLFDLVMLCSCALLYQSGEIGFAGVLLPTLALMSSFGPVVALANLGSTLQNTFAAGNRVLDILEEIPVVEEVVGREPVQFSKAAAENVSFLMVDNRCCRTYRWRFQKQCDWDCGTKRKWKIDPTQTFYAFLEGTAGQSGNFKCECGCN